MPKAQAKKNRKRRRQKQPKPLRSLILAFAFTCLVVYLGVTAIETAIKIGDTNDKIELAKAEYEQIQNDNQNTSNLLKNADEIDIVERIARERLGYVFPDEKVYYDVN